MVTTSALIWSKLVQTKTVKEVVFRGLNCILFC